MSQAVVTDEEIELVGPILQRLMWANAETREKIQEYGVNVLPINFYSNVPSIEEIKNSYEYTQDSPPYLNEKVFDSNLLENTLKKMVKVSGDFNPPLEGNEETCERYFWNNSQFGYSDAMSYYCFIRMQKPNNVVEIGSGFSTLVAIEAVERNGSGTIHCIEPFPRPFLKNNAAIELHQEIFQNLTLDFFDDILGDDDILFIDSTHTVKTGSDCLHLYLRILPKIKRRVLVHAHDIFLPFGLPQDWLLDRQIFWTEQYLLLALLIDNPKAKVIYGSNYNANWNPSLIDELMGGKYPGGGGSLWFVYDGRES